MCQYSSDDGFANDWHLVHLGSRAVGGAAVVLTEATAVTPEGRISPDDLGIWKDAHVEMLARIFRVRRGARRRARHAARARRAQGEHRARRSRAASRSPSPTAAGRRSSRPSALPFSDGLADADGARRQPAFATIVEAFAAAARRVLEAGGRDRRDARRARLPAARVPVAAVAIIATDEYGGSFEGRIRLLVRGRRGVRERVAGDACRCSCGSRPATGRDGGWTVEDSVALARRLAPLGVDAIDCSSGGNVARRRIPVGAGYQVPFAEQIRRDAGFRPARSA